MAVLVGVPVFASTRNSGERKYVDPKFKATMGEEAPSGMTLLEIPNSMKLHSADRYRYEMISNHPVIVEHSSHKIAHSWD